MKNNSRKFIVALLALGILISSLLPNPSSAQTTSPGYCIVGSQRIAVRVAGSKAFCQRAYGASADFEPNASAANQKSGTGGETKKDVTSQLSCSWSGYFFDCVILVLAYIAYAVFWAVGWILGIAANLFSYTLGLTIDNANYAGIPAIQNGWAFTRDIVNIFFIFALLFIAIATILGIESYGAKKLLARFIIIALLVNFSLLATQAIIFITNALAFELYNVVPDNQKSTLLSSANAKPNFQKDIGGAIYKSTLQQKLFMADPSKLDDVKAIGIGTVDVTTKDTIKINLSVFVTIVIGIFIMLLAAFIFLAGAFFFVARMAVLWLLMILAPFGFVFLVLPATKGYAQKWWTTLQNQALFAPAFMFFIIITIKIMESGPLTKTIEKAQTLQGTPLLFLVVMQSVITFILLGGSLIIAKTLGIYGAEGAMKMATGAGAAFRGYVGRGAAAPFRWGGRKAAEGGGALAGRVAEALPTTGLRGAFARPFARLGAKAAARAEVFDKKHYDEQAKKYAGASPAAVARIMATANPGLQRSLFDQVKGKKRELTLEEMDKYRAGSVVQLGQNMEQFGLDKDVARASNSLVKAVGIMNPKLKKEKEPEEYQKAMDRWAEQLTNKELSQLNAKEIEQNNNVQVSIFGTVTKQRLNALLRNRDQRDAIVKVIQRDVLENPEIAKVAKSEEDQMRLILQNVYKNAELSRGIAKDLATNLVAGSVKVRGETGGAPQEPPPAEEREDTA